jgi:hypothetical protein
MEKRLLKDKSAKTVEDYIYENQMYGDVPKYQFGHQFKLLFHKQNEPKSQMDLLPPDAVLGLIKDSKTLLLLQNDIGLLNRFFDMGLRSDGVMELFDSLFYSWWQQMRMTGALGGTERWLQSFLEPVGVPYESFSFLEKQKAKKMAKKRLDVMGQIRKIRGEGGEGEDKIYS